MFRVENIFQAISSNATDEVVDSILQNEKIQIKRIVSKGHVSPLEGWYNQDGDEWVIVLSGQAVVEFKGGSVVTLSAGDYIDIPAHTEHKVKWTDPDIETIWLAVHY